MTKTSAPVPSSSSAEEPVDEPLTYGTYLRVPELLSLQTPRGVPDAHDEMLFIIVQQAQELWFKQILHDLRTVIDRLLARDLLDAARLLERINRVLRVLSDEVRVMETLPPSEFRRFRGALKSSSGFESEQFRELELASGLNDEMFLKLAARFVDMDEFRAGWPVTLHEAFLAVFSVDGQDPVRVLVSLYASPHSNQELFALAEAMTEYEVRFQEWRFQHLKLVERVIGDRASGTGGSPGSAYLTKTLAYRFFPELWEARNRLSAGE